MPDLPTEYMGLRLRSSVLGWITETRRGSGDLDYANVTDLTDAAWALIRADTATQGYIEGVKVRQGLI
jgi:hypothetical protein